MLKLSLHPRDGSHRFLAIGAHPDDIEIGCGGTLLELLAAHTGAEVWWIVLSGTDERAEEARRSAAGFLDGAGATSVVVRGFRDGFFPYQGAELKDYFEEIKRGFAPDVVFTHGRGDLHQDHRLVGELTWNTFRDHLILEYEIPKYDGDIGTPNVFCHVSEENATRKVDALLEHFGSQRARPWFTEDLFRSLLRLRGMESQSPTRYAEAFYGRKIVL